MLEAFIQWITQRSVPVPPHLESMHFILWRKSVLSSNITYKKGEVKAEKIDLLNWTAHIFSQSVAAEESWDNSLGRGYLSQKQIAAVGTFLPNELITLVNSGRKYTTFIGANMIADISGFTTLCETYAKFGPEGAFLLTAMLNSYIGAMVDLIYTFGGDLLKFAGDAFIAVWHCRLYEFLSYKVHEAISCAMHIQYSLGSYLTDVGVMLNVKIAVSAGNFVFSLVGDDFNSTYIIYGYPVLEAKRAESMATSGDTIVAPSAWNFVSPRDYSFEPMTDGYVKMKRILYDPRVMTREVFDFDARQLVEINIKNETLRNLTRKTDLVSSTMTFEENIRPNLFGPAIRGISEELRPFVIAPVMQQIDANSSFEYLTEMRQVTIMFIKMKPNTTLESSVIRLTDTVYCTISKIVKSKLGLINKVCMFDKDIMFLVIFGMKGFKEKDEALRCLKTAYQMHSTLSAEENIKSLSTGITIGTTYCGVVGHPFRKEYTVIGGAVNRAARLMCAFNNVISCDHSVVLNSKLPLAYFNRLPPKFLKGIGQVTNIYAYNEQGLDVSKIPPILGRTDILIKYKDILAGDSLFKGIIVMGDPRCGKTRLLNEFVEIADALSWRTIWISVHTNLRQGVCLLHKVFANLLGKHVKDRMASLIKLYVDDKYYEYLYVLNDIFDVNFAFPYKYVTPPEVTPMFLFKKTLRLISTRTVILIDDAHGLDLESWNVFLEIIKHPKYIIVFSLPSAWKNKQVSTQACLTSSKVVTFHLEPLPFGSVPALVCQMLNVEAVPRKLIKVLIKLSRGNPGWVQTFLLSYIEAGFIAVKLTEPNNLSGAVYIIPDKSLLRSVGYSAGEDFEQPSKTKSAEDFNSDADMAVPVCKIIKQLDENALPATFDDVIMSMFDRQSSFEQLLLKCASVLGTSFFRLDLIRVMGDPPELHVAPAMRRLFQLHVLGCATETNKEDNGGGKIVNTTSTQEIKELNLEEVKCNCNIPADELQGLPNYAYCRNPAFKFSVFCSTINTTIPMNQKIDFHAKALQSIKQRSQKCEYCRINEIKEADVTVTDVPTFAELSADTFSSDKSSEYKPKPDESLPGMMKDLAKFHKKVVPVDDISESGSIKEKPSKWHVFGVLKKVIRRRKKRKTQNYFDIELPKVMKCVCFKDLNETYEQLVHHARMAELVVVELKYLIAFAIHSLIFFRYEKALQLLKEAESTREHCLAILNLDLQTAQDKAKMEKKKKSIPAKYMKYTKKQISTYLGQSYLHIGNTNIALGHLSVLTKTSDLSILFVIQMLLIYWPEIPLAYRKKLRRGMVLKSDVHSNLARTYLFKNNLSKATSTALSGAKYGNATDSLRHRCTSLSFAMDLNVLGGKFKKVSKMELKSLRATLSLYEGNSVLSCLFMGQLYTAIFKNRFFSGNLQGCIEAGHIALKIAQSGSATTAEMYIIPLLAHALLLTRNFEALQEILHPNMYMKEELNTSRHIAKMKLYHCLIIEIFLEGALALENPIRIFPIMKKSVNQLNLNIEHPVTRNIGMVVWLWYLRKGEHGRAAHWQVPEYIELDSSQENLAALLRIIQCQLLWLENKMKGGMPLTPRVANCAENLRYLFKEIHAKVHKYTPYLLPRYYHMKAYYTILTYTKFGTKTSSLPGYDLLMKGHRFAVKQGNVMEEAWITHSRRLWYKPEKITDPDFWISHMDDDAVGIDDFENYAWPDIMFSLKIPEPVEEEIQRLRSFVSLPDSVSIGSRGEE